MCVLIKDLRRSVVYVCANKRLTSTSPTHLRKKSYPPTPPYFAMYMQIKHLQRSVGDRYANKGLSGEITSREQRSHGRGLDLQWFSLSLIFLKSFLCVLCVSALRVFPVFSCFFPSQKLHYNALFAEIRPQHAL